MNQHSTQTKISVPSGFIVARQKWKQSDLSQILKSHARVLFEDRFDYVDIFLSDSLAVMIIEEQNLNLKNNFKRALVKLRQLNNFKGVVLIERKSPISQQSDFITLQKFICLDLGLVCIPFSDYTEAGNLLVRMANIEENPKYNDIKSSVKPNISQKSIDESILETLSVIPKLGSAKSKLLLSRFHSVHAICNASVEEISEVVGYSAAVEIKKFFTQRTL